MSSLVSVPNKVCVLSEYLYDIALFYYTIRHIVCEDMYIGHYVQSLMAQWLWQASQWHEM